MLNDYTLGDQTIADRRARGQAPEPFLVNEEWDEPCCDPDLRPDCHECGHEFDAPCCCVNDLPEHCNRPAGHEGTCGAFVEADHALQVEGWRWCRQ